MNNCNGKGTCNQVTAQCECESGYKFADCSEKVIELTYGHEDVQEMKGPTWFTMQYSGSASSKLQLNPNITSEVYFLKDVNGDPNNFVYDMSFKSVLGPTTFTASELGLTSDNGYSVAVYVPAVNETANELLNAQLGITFSESATRLGAFLASLVALTALLIN